MQGCKSVYRVTRIWAHLANEKTDLITSPPLWLPEPTPLLIKVHSNYNSLQGGKTWLCKCSVQISITGGYLETNYFVATLQRKFKNFQILKPTFILDIYIFKLYSLAKHVPMLPSAVRARALHRDNYLFIQFFSQCTKNWQKTICFFMMSCVYRYKVLH